MGEADRSAGWPIATNSRPGPGGDQERPDGLEIVGLGGGEGRLSLPVAAQIAQGAQETGGETGQGAGKTQGTPLRECPPSREKSAFSRMARKHPVSSHGVTLAKGGKDDYLSSMLVATLLAVFGTTEIIILAAVALLLFGTSKLPALGVGMGKMLRGFKKEMKALNEDEAESEASLEAENREIDVTPGAASTKD